jgi:GT2 family glycosyltransferase
MKVSVLVASFGVRERLARCLTSVADAHETIVVDNASPDDSARLVRERFPSARLIAWDENRGFGAAVNEAARHATGEALFLLNPDAEVPAGSLGRIETALDDNPGAVAVGFRQVDEHGRWQLTIGPGPSLSLDALRGVVQRRLDRGAHWLGRRLDRALSRPRKVPWVAGSALLVSRSAFEKIGGFDERYFLYFEDVDFCLRLRAAAGRVVYDPRVTIVHARGASASRDVGRARKEYRRSQRLFWRTHRGALTGGLVHAYTRLRGEAL